jgi:hypothetical protein
MVHGTVNLDRLRMFILFLNNCCQKLKFAPLLEILISASLTINKTVRLPEKI